MEFSQGDHKFMRLALLLAKRAARQGEVPVGAVLVDEAGRLFAAEHNRSISHCDPTAHAEMLALRKGAGALGNYRLTGATLYVTLEPCPMCAGALVWARIKRIVFATPDPKAGALGSIVNLAEEKSLNHHPKVEAGLLAEESKALLRDFFAQRRK